eukprot:GILJ01019290.1.p1 GENE.GILJ01019290.1~~GILJ01019290.1.p1  ORF type:complete len:318 (+),score=18.70 GILJ01019290.1:637-1590(+)
MVHPHQIFKVLLLRGDSVASAAAVVGISLRTASRWRKAVPKQQGRRPLNVHACRRARLCARIAEKVQTRNHRTIPQFPTAPRVASELLRLHGIKASKSTVLRDLKRLGFRTLVRPRHPNLQNADVRRSFARIWRSCDPSILIFSDEHFISVNDNSHRTMLVGPGQRPLPREHQRRQNVSNFQIWAAIGVGWRSELVFFPKKNPDDDSRKPGGFRLNAAAYVRRCLSKICPYLQSSGRVFMQDGARCHWAGSVVAYLDRKGVTYMTGFPSSSPDLNPIESVWACLDSEISKRMPQTEAELKAAALEAWSSIKQCLIRT